MNYETAPFELHYSDITRNGVIRCRVNLSDRDTGTTLHEKTLVLDDAGHRKQFAEKAATLLGGDVYGEVFDALTAKLADIRVGIPDYVDVSDLMEANPAVRPPVIEGMVRTGDVMNIIGATKTRKSWTGGELLICGATGRPWLERFAVNQGAVLLIDNELHPSDIAFRIREMSKAMGLMRDDLKGRFKVWSLRGHLVDVLKLCARLERLEPGTFGVIVLDSLYRAFPEDAEENSNTQGTAIYNRLAHVADKLGAVVVVIHHSSKGVQGGKSVADVGAGAGAYARAADAHLVMREHEEPGCVVVDVANRSFGEVPRFCLRWRFPRYHVDESLDPAKIKTDRKPGGRPRKDESESAVWTPNSFAEQIITANRQTADEIIWKAKEVGLSGRTTMSLLRAAVAKGLVHEWPKSGRNTPSIYANRAPTLTEIPPSAPKPSKAKEKRAKE